MLNMLIFYAVFVGGAVFTVYKMRKTPPSEGKACVYEGIISVLFVVSFVCAGLAEELYGLGFPTYGVFLFVMLVFAAELGGQYK